MTEILCKCGCARKKMVRTADVKRGWGKFYSKSCKAKHQEKRTGQYKRRNLALQRKAKNDPENLTSKELEVLGAEQWEINLAFNEECLDDSTSSHGQD